MAIKFKDAVGRVNNRPLTDEELKYINELETWMDSEIKRYFTGSNSIQFDLYVIQFKRHYSTNDILKFKEHRAKLMYDELVKRYEAAGWKHKIDLADPSDRWSWDYWYLFGDNKTNQK